MDIPSTQEHSESAQETARIICECVNNLLTDLDAVSLQLKQEKNGTPQSQVVLQFLHHCLEAFPECYVRKPSDQEEGENSQELNKYKLSKDFTCWIISRLLRIISSPDCEELHKKASSVVIAIIKLVQVKDIGFYKKLIDEFMGLYSDLLHLSEEYFASDEDDELFDVKLLSGRFQQRVSDNVGQLVMPPKLIELNNYFNCQSVMKYLCHIFQENLSSIQQFVTTTIRQLYDMSIRTMALSDMTLMPAAFSVLTDVMGLSRDHNEFEVRKYLVIVSTVAEYIAFNESDEMLETSLKESFSTVLTFSHSLLYMIRDILLRKILQLVQQCICKDNIEEILSVFMSKVCGCFRDVLDESLSDTLTHYCCSRIKKQCSKELRRSILSMLVCVKERFKGTQIENFQSYISQLKEKLVADKNFRDKELLMELLANAIRIALICISKEKIKVVQEGLEVDLLSQKMISLLHSKRKIKITDTFLLNLYDFIGSILKLLIYTNSVEKKLGQRFLEIVSLPWLHSIDPPWFDFEPSFFNQYDLLQLYNLTKSSNEKLIQKKSLKIMSMLPRYSESPAWITHVVQHTLGNPSCQQEERIIKCLPLFVHGLRETSNSVIQEDVTYLIRSGTNEIKLAIAKYLSSLVCVTFGCGKILVENSKVITKCQRDEQRGNITSIQTKSESLLKLLVQTIKQSNCKELKISLLQSLPTLLFHVDRNEFVSNSSVSVLSTLLEFMKDADYQVRYAFSHYAPLLVEETEHVNIQQQLIDNLSEVFSTASEKNDIPMLETLVLTLGNIGAKADGDFLALMIVSLFNCFVTQNKIVAAISLNQIHEIAKAKSISCQQLFFNHKHQLCDIAVKKFLKVLEDGGEVHAVTEAFFDIAKLFEFKDVKAFLLSTTTEMLPKIVQKSSQHASVVLRLYAKYSQQNRREMMFCNFKYIFSYLVRLLSKESDLENCLRYLQDETDVELSSLLISERQSVFNQLILYLSVNRDQVFQGFSILACNDPKYEGPKEFKTEADVAIFLHPKLLGVLAFFNSALVHSPAYERRIALKSIISLINIMGAKYLTPIRLKIMAILKLALRFKDDFPDLCVASWDSFVRNIEVECLGPMLGQIVATILPLLDKCPEQIVAIFTFLAVENKIVLGPFFKDVYYIPDHPALNKIKSMVEANYPVAKTSKELKEHISSAIKGISNENEDVRRFALKRLIILFEENNYHLNQMLTREDNIDDILKQTIDVLLVCGKAHDKETFGLIGKCLGQLGAVDPGRVENMSEQILTEQICHQSIEEMNFSFDFINELCRAFLAASNTRAQDCAAFAIQEVLQFYSCTDKDPGSNGYQLWRKFPSSTQELLYPHLRSKYVNSGTYNWAKHSIPIYGSSKGISYKEWICNWTNYMIYLFNEERISKAFKPCMAIIKHDIKMGLFILPYVVLYTILCNNLDLVHVEIMAILNAVNNTDSVSDFMHSCTQTIFSILDFLQNWKALYSQLNNNIISQNSEKYEDNMELVNKLLEKIPKDLLAKCSFNCNALSRCLMYFEQFIEQQADDIENHLEFLQKIYFSLDEPDSIAGVAATRKKTTSLQQQIVEHESSGKLRDAVACYERAIQIEPDNIKHYKGMLDGLIGLGQLNNALMDVGGVLNKRNDWRSELNAYQAEISWRLGQWDNLKKTVEENPAEGSWSMSLGRLLISLKEQDCESFTSTLSTVRASQTQYLLSTGVESSGYQRAYKSMIRLHMLEDIEASSKFLLTNTSNNEQLRRRFITNVNQRLHITEASFKSRESILNLRRILLLLLPDKQKLIPEQDKGWLITTKIARKDGLVQTAYSSLLNVVDSTQADILIEKSKWFAHQGDVHKALLCLQKGTANMTIDLDQSKYNEAKISLLKAEWMEETEHYEPEPVLGQYKDAVGKHPEWEKGHFCLAKYYEKLMNAWDEKDSKENKKAKRNDFTKFVIKHYGTSLQYGSKYIFQSLPRLLTLWLDFGQRAQEIIEGAFDTKQAEKTYFKDKLVKLNEDIFKFAQVLPAYQFLTAFSQLVSRICHSNFSVWKILKVIICKIFRSYKHQAIWSLVAVSKSSYPTRSERCKEIFHEVSCDNISIKQFVTHSLALTDRLLEVSNRKCGSKETKLSMKRDFPRLVRLLSSGSFSQIMVPLQATLTVNLPSTTDPKQQYNPFPDNLPMIIGVEDTVDVLSSLQKPKKIVVKASNGYNYTLMCKPKDDLRKDSRLMEFNSLVNKLLLRDPDCRRRKLHIRTYAVIPLNEECGLLEWVSNTTGLRYILNKIYKEKGLFVKISELKEMYEAIRAASVKTKVDIFVKRVLPKYPAVFHEWFLTNFSNPTKWYQARLAYCRTAAVMSMVGYTLGLGDRHGENILFDSVSGDCVHVDFNCLFNKGETFDCPERVPFRLTHNMLRAMGPLRNEGVFRKSCEMTMKLMRNQRDSFLSVLSTFLYDPLVEWKKESRKKASGETTNDMAVKILRNVEHRLKGYINSTMIHLPLSIEGQVHQLIRESTDIENLAQMYIGWAAYM